MIDMNDLILRAKAAVERKSDGEKFVLTDKGEVVSSAQRMTKGHAAGISGKNCWAFEAEHLQVVP